MSDLNKKNINYGALNRFYQDLKSHDLSDLNDKIDNIQAKPIENVESLSDAEENKDSVLRLNNDKQVYISKYGEMEVPITPTNRLPDAQQIDKAYLLLVSNIGNTNIYYYKGDWNIICNDGELILKVWLRDLGNNHYEFYLTEDNTENITINSYCKNGDYMEYNVNVQNKTISTNDYSVDDIITGMSEETIGSQNLYIIPAIYNAPESAQIGNATFSDGNYGYDAVYSGEEIAYNDSTWYKWTTSNGYYITNKKASEIFGNFESRWMSDVQVVYYDGNDYDNELVVGDIGSIYIPQLNAPDSEQVDNAYLREDYFANTWLYEGNETTITYNNQTLTVYTWKCSTDIHTIVSTKRAYEIYINYRDNDSVHFYALDDEDYIKELTFNSNELEEVSTVKYQRTTGLEFGYQWKKVATEQYVDDAIDNIDVPEYVAGEGIAIDSANTISCTVKPIADVSALPDAEENKDSVLRLNGDEQVYLSKATPITPTNALPDSEQIGKATMWYDENVTTFRYAGSYKVICSDGTLNWYLWGNVSGNTTCIITESSAEYINSDENKSSVYSEHGYWLDEISGATITQTGVTTTLSMSSFIQNAQRLFDLGENICCPLVLTYNESESIQIGNAYIVTNGGNDLYIYTGEEITWENKTGYKWVNVNQSTFQPNPNIILILEDKAEDIMFYNTGADWVAFNTKMYTSTDGGTTISEVRNQSYDAYIIQKNAPDSEQVGNAYIDYNGVPYYYTGEQATINGYTGYKWELSNHNDFIITVGVKAEDFHKTYITLGSGDVKIFRNSTSSEINYSDAGDIMIVPYKRTANYQWKRVVTEDELDGIGDAFQALEARIYALEHPTTIE